MTEIEQQAESVKGAVRGAMHVLGQVDSDEFRALKEQALLESLLLAVDMLTSVSRKLREIEGRL